jgi:hypothetical protein
MGSWVSPYSGKGTTSRYTLEKVGVYFIRDKYTKEIVYIGMSRSSLYKASYRHFQNWNTSVGYRVVYSDRNGYEIRYIFMDKRLVKRTEKRLIHKFKPRDNKERYEYDKQEEHCPF